MSKQPQSILRHGTCNHYKTVTFTPDTNFTPRRCKPDFTAFRTAATTTTTAYAAALDSGATTSCFPSSFRGTNYTPITHPQQAILAQAADDQIMSSVAKDSLNEPLLPPASREVHLFNEISIPLLSVNKLCAGDLAVLFHGPTATVFKPHSDTVTIDGEPIMVGSLDKATELYMVQVNAPSKLQGGNPSSKDTIKEYISNTQPSFHRANSLTIRTVPALINFYHLTLGAPSITTWLQAIDKGWFSNFPGLTSGRVRQYCTNKMETAKGHLKLKRQHVQSTKPKQIRSNNHTVSAHVFEPRNQLSMDMTGRYPITSKRGNQYILVMIDWDTNYIKLIPLKSRKADTYVNAYKEGYEWFKEHGVQAKLLKLDNEISNTLIQAITADKLEYQLASPDDHRQLPAERAIRDVKAHFISIRNIASPNFPKDCWDLLLPHTEDTLNLLRPSKTNPLISAYTSLRGHYNYMKHPIAPAGCKILVHDRPTTRGSWADRGTEGYFISQASNHYRNFTCYIPNTNSIRITNTIEFFPHNCSLPALKPIDTVAHILSDLRTALTTFPRNNLIAGPNHSLLQALYDIQGLLGLDEHHSNTPIRKTYQRGDNSSKGDSK